MSDLLLWVWNGIKYIMGILGSMISFKLSFIFLLCIAYYAYKALSNVIERNSRSRVRGTEK